MSEKLKTIKDLEGNYRFLIHDGNGRLVIGTPTSANNPNHREMAQEMDYEVESVKGGYVEVWDEGNQMSFCGRAYTIPEASEEEFDAAKKRGIKLFQR